jgi:hypothetical protein
LPAFFFAVNIRWQSQRWSLLESYALGILGTSGIFGTFGVGIFGTFGRGTFGIFGAGIVDSPLPVMGTGLA